MPIFTIRWHTVGHYKGKSLKRHHFWEADPVIPTCCSLSDNCTGLFTLSSWSIWGTGMDEAWWSQYRRFICLVTVIGRGWSPSTTILAMYLWRNIRVFFRCLGYARLNTKYVQKAEMIPSSIPELRNTSMWSTFRMFGALLAKAIFQSRSVNWIVGYGLSRSVYSKPKGKKQN